jgi:hypothetical protein
MAARLAVPVFVRRRMVMLANAGADVVAGRREYHHPPTMAMARTAAAATASRAAEGMRDTVDGSTVLWLIWVRVGARSATPVSRSSLSNRRSLRRSLAV